MTKEEKQKVINALRISAPVMAVTQEEFNAYIQTLNKIMDWLEQEPVIDKIRAEIENDWQLKKYPSSPFACGLRRAIEIIDKYKAESEE